MLVARQAHTRRIQLHRLQVHLLCQRAHLAQLQHQAIEGGQGRAVALLHLELAGLDHALHQQAGVLVLLKRQGQVGVQHGRFQRDGHAGRHVGRVVGQVQRIDLEARLRLARVHERQGFGRAVEPGAVQHKGQLGQHLDLALRIEVADEGQLHVQRAQLVVALHGLVVEGELATAQSHVVERELGRLGLGIRRVGRALCQAFEDVVEVVVPIAQMPHENLGRVDLHRIEHGRQAKQRLNGRVHVDAIDRELIALPVALGHGQLLQGQLQRPGLELNLANRHLAAQQSAGLLLGLPLQDGRHGQPAHTPQHQHRAAGHDHALRPALACGAAFGVKLGGCCVAGTGPRLNGCVGMGLGCRVGLL